MAIVNKAVGIDGVLKLSILTSLSHNQSLKMLLWEKLEGCSVNNSLEIGDAHCLKCSFSCKSYPWVCPLFWIWMDYCLQSIIKDFFYGKDR
jgi:hypothetical protein